ncbi:MAG: V-type ATPase subunit [Acutalibacteraceae bacterium]
MRCRRYKTALRCASAGRTAQYIKNALCPCESLDSDELIHAAFEGVDAVADMLANTELGSLADSLKEGLTAFEKKCDELSAQQMTEAKYTAFGPDPLAAYYNAVETETKNVRVILSAKLNGFSAETIRARVREVYA